MALGFSFTDFYVLTPDRMEICLLYTSFSGRAIDPSEVLYPATSVFWSERDSLPLFPVLQSGMSWTAFTCTPKGWKEFKRYQ